MKELPNDAGGMVKVCFLGIAPNLGGRIQGWLVRWCWMPPVRPKRSEMAVTTKREKVVANPEIFWRTIGLLFKIWPYAASFFELQIPS